MIEPFNSAMAYTLQSVESKPAPQGETMDLFIGGGTVVTMDAEHRVIEEGGVAIEGDAIVAVGKRSDLESQSNEARTTQGCSVADRTPGCLVKVASQLFGSRVWPFAVRNMATEKMRGG